MLTNLYEEMRSVAAQFSERLACCPQVKGICYLGGLGQNAWIDRYSDLDIAVFVDRRSDGAFLPDFSFTLHGRGRPVEFNVSQHAYEDEDDSAWDDARRCAYRNAVVILDREGRLARLLQQMCGAPGNTADELVALLNQVWWRGIYHSHASIRRGQLISANLLINEAVAMCVDCLLRLDKQAGLHTKWAEYGLVSGQYARHLELVAPTMCLEELSTKATVARWKRMSALRRQVLREVRQRCDGLPADFYRHWAVNSSRRQLGTGDACRTIIGKCAELKPLSAIEKRHLHGALSFALAGTMAGNDILIDRLRADGFLSGDLLDLVEMKLGGQDHRVVATATSSVPLN